MPRRTAVVNRSMPSSAADDHHRTNGFFPRASECSPHRAADRSRVARPAVPRDFQAKVARASAHYPLTRSAAAELRVAPGMGDSRTQAGWFLDCTSLACVALWSWLLRCQPSCLVHGKMAGPTTRGQVASVFVDSISPVNNRVFIMVATNSRGESNQMSIITF